MKKLMILGAGVYQLPLIRKAHSMGLHVTVVSTEGRYPGFAYADAVYPLDTRDGEGILAAAEKEGIDGIATTGTDVAVRALGLVCDRMKLTGIPLGAAEILTDKARMKQAFGTAVSTPAFRIVRSEAEAAAAAAQIGYPVMVKACDSSGSRGISKVTSDGEIREAVQAARACSRAEHIVVEEFAAGTEIGVDGFIRGGKLQLFLPHAKDVHVAGAVCFPGGHRFPFRCSAALHDAIRREMEQVAAVTGMNDCAFNADVMVTPDEKVFVLEAGGRCGATGIPELITLHTGIDYYAQIIRTALGEPTDFRVMQEQPCMSVLLFDDEDALVTGIDREAISQICADPHNMVDTLSLDIREGDRICRAENGTHRYGQLILKTDDAQTAERVVKAVRQCIRKTEPPEKVHLAKAQGK